MLLVIILIGNFYLYFKEDTVAASDTNSSQTIKEVQASIQTITKNINKCGKKFLSATTEKLELNTYRYFDEIYYETDDFVAEGDIIFKIYQWNLLICTI